MTLIADSIAFGGDLQMAVHYQQMLMSFLILCTHFICDVFVDLMYSSN